MTNDAKESERDADDSVQGGDSPDANAVGREEGRLFTSNFLFATMANFVCALSMLMIIATLPVYVVNLGGSRADAGLVTGAIAVTALISRPFWGWLTDAWSRRPLVLIGIFLHAVSNIVYLLGGAIPLLVIGRLVQGLGLSCYTTAANVYIADIAPLKRRAEAVGIFSAAQAFGLVVGPVLGFAIVEWSGFHELFYITGGLAAVAFFFSIFTQETRRPSNAVRPPWSPLTGIVAVDALPVAWIALCLGIGFGTINAFISIFAQSRGVQNPGYFFMVQAIALLVARMFAGRLADRVGRVVVIVPGVILMAVGLAILPPAQGFPQFAASAALFGFGFGAAHPATTALLYDRVRPEQRGLATSTFFTGFDVGFLIGSVLLGLVGRSWGFDAMWWISAACALLSLAGVAADRRRGVSTTVFDVETVIVHADPHPSSEKAEAPEGASRPKVETLGRP